jgi:pimeloyl-ACP methyl ester carboxylesterase
MNKLTGFVVSVALLGAMLFGLGNVYKYEIYQAAINFEADLSDLKEKDIDISIGEIVYFENSQVDKKPSVLLVHGFGANKENWLRFSRSFKEDYHVVAVDLPGHGKSLNSFDLNYSLENQVAWLHEFTQSIGLKTFHLAGNSMGGAISALYAVTYPEQVTSATLIDPAGIHDFRSVMQDLIDEGNNPLVVEDTKGFNELMDFALEQRPFIPWPITEVSAEHAKALKPLHNKLWKDMQQGQGESFKPLLEKIRVPTLVQWGEQDRVINYKNIEVFKTLIPSVKTHVWPNVGHAPMVEIPNESAELMLSHIQG